jgi:hypothetical protein
MNDTQLINYLETHNGIALVNDDFGRWAVAQTGFQNIEDENGVSALDKAITMQTTFIIEADEWYPTIREAINVYLEGTLKAARAEESNDEGSNSEGL